MDLTPTRQMTMWSGLDVRTESPEDLRTIEQFYRDSYLKEVGKNYLDLRFGHLYELLATGRGSRDSRFLTAFELTDGQATAKNVQDEESVNVPSAPAVWQSALTTSWSLIYRRVAETGPEAVTPYAIYMVGVNPPAGLTPEELVEFNDFYTNVHMPEVAERRHCLRASRYELYRELKSPVKRRPQFLAIYELDEKAASNKRHIGGPYASGPEVWRKHTTPWRLWYQRLPD